MVERENPALPVSQQCRLLAVSRSAVYRKPAEVGPEDLAIMALITTAKAGVQPPSPPALMPNGLVGDKTSTIRVAKNDGRRIGG